MSAVQTPPIPADVLAFCREQGILELLQAGLRLLHEEFPGCPVELSLMESGDCDARWVVIDVTVVGDWQDALARHQAFTFRLSQGDLSPLITYTLTPVQP